MNTNGIALIEEARKKLDGGTQEMNESIRDIIHYIGYPYQIDMKVYGHTINVDTSRDRRFDASKMSDIERFQHAGALIAFHIDRLLQHGGKV